MIAQQLMLKRRKEETAILSNLVASGLPPINKASQLSQVVMPVSGQSRNVKVHVGSHALELTGSRMSSKVALFKELNEVVRAGT